MNANTRYNQLLHVAALKGKWEPIENDKVTQILESFNGGVSANAKDSGGSARELDASSLDPATIRTWLAALPVPAPETVAVIWLDDQAGIRTEFSQFVKHYDEFWYPSRDDTLVVAIDWSWCLSLNHEEIFRWRTVNR